MRVKSFGEHIWSEAQVHAQEEWLKLLGWARGAVARQNIQSPSKSAIHFVFSLLPFFLNSEVLQECLDNHKALHQKNQERRLSDSLFANTFPTMLS